MAVFDEDFEGVPNGTAISTGNSDFTTVQGTRTMVGDTALSKEGTTSLKVDGNGNTSLFHEFTAVTTHYIRIYLYLRTAPGTNTPLFTCQTAANANVLDVRLTAGRLLQCRNSSLALQTTTSTAIPLNEWCRIELACVNGSATLRTFIGAAVDNAVGSFTEQETWSYATTSIAETNVGGSVTTTLAYNMDAVAASDSDWVGPLAVPAALVHRKIGRHV